MSRFLLKISSRLLLLKSVLEWILVFQTTPDLQKNLETLNVTKNHAMRVREVTEIPNHCHQRTMIGKVGQEDVMKTKYLQTSGRLQEVKVEKIFSVLMKVRLFVKLASIELFIGSILKDFL